MKLFVSNREDRGKSPSLSTTEIPSDRLAQFHSAEHLSLTQAEDLLDWLEGHGIAAQDVQLDAEGRMSVRWSA